MRRNYRYLALGLSFAPMVVVFAFLLLQWMSGSGFVAARSIMALAVFFLLSNTLRVAWFDFFDFIRVRSGRMWFQGALVSVLLFLQFWVAVWALGLRQF